ncbi:inorganic phosphate transporter [Devosia riboflavina]|uniref:Phosphate transporter n=1 Tax=Devosia riboflavina TaxID=46914 RepID=A0A087LWF3_9HYPH|nr:inorganic phosphate transporter [Devosia riboflavina]KFL28956.1 inorganic phosphate transporter [Devosia riboflavina]
MNRNPLDKELQHISGMNTASQALVQRMAAPGLAVLFLALAALWAFASVGHSPAGTVVVIASIVAGYMALNIGANDVANNMGPAVGARALTMPAALLIAAICEAAGALLAGGDVVQTVASDLLVGLNIAPASLVLVMISALLASAMWVHLATFIGAPVSTTHSIIGGVTGAGIAAAGLSAVSWPSILTIAFGWVVSPVAGGAIAALLLLLTQVTITGRIDKLQAARTWVPAFVAVMAGTFAMYLADKGLQRVWDPGTPAVVVVGLLAAAIGWTISFSGVRRRSQHLENRKKHVATLFRLPLILAAALLSFSHGANDVANAIGPLAAIVSTLADGQATPDADLPFWVLSIGAFGIAVGLALFGPRLIRTVGEQITKLNEIRAFCAALSTGITVLIASALGMPVSTTHIAIGAVFGIGFLREYRSRREMERKAVPIYARFVDPRALNATPEMAFANAREADHRRLIRRQSVYRIMGAWMVTLPCSALLAALVFFVVSQFAL